MANPSCFSCHLLRDDRRGRASARAAAAFGKPLNDQIEPIGDHALINNMNALAPKGRHYFIRTQSLAGIHEDIIDVLVERVRQFSSPFSAIVLHHFRGAACDVNASETAFALRRDHFMAEIIAAWEPRSPSEDERHMRWARQASSALAPHALAGGYINMLDKSEQERVPLAFGPNYERLLDLKRTYDPDDVFHSTVGHIAPRPSSGNTDGL
jgi:hypothetical protein